MEGFTKLFINRSADFKTKDITWGNTPMPQPKRFEIHFDTAAKTYFSEELVTGHVTLENEEPINVKGVKLRFKGECCFHFSEAKKIIRKRKKKKKAKDEKEKLKEKEDEMLKEMKELPKSKIWHHIGSVHSNGIQGVMNPGYVPEVKFEWPNRTGLVRSSSPILKKENGLTDQTTKRPPSKTHFTSRPKSCESIWNDGAIRGPTQHYRAMETYFDCEFYIYGHKYQKDEKEALPPGTHTFPFAFNLPPNLPPSFSSEKGIIRYMVAAVLDHPLTADFVRKTFFNVLSIFDLNMISHATSSGSRSKSINPCGLFCHKGPITLSVSIPQRGFVPGENIVISAEIDNISGKCTKQTRVTLKQIISYIMPNDLKSHKVERKVKEMVRGKLAPGESDFWQDVIIQIPPLVPANVHITCRLMNVEYLLEMVVELSRPWKDLKAQIPILIGSVPLRQNFSTFVPAKRGGDDQRSLVPGIKYSGLPSFAPEESIFGLVSMEKHYADLTGDWEYMGIPIKKETLFAPSYPVYKLIEPDSTSRKTSTTSDGQDS